MPRRYSRAWYIHVLAMQDVWILRDGLGYDVCARDFYPKYQPLSTVELARLAYYVKSPKRGRPDTGLNYRALAHQVDRILKSGKRKSERGACQYVAENEGISPHMLRKVYRATRPN